VPFRPRHDCLGATRGHRNGDRFLHRGDPGGAGGPEPIREEQEGSYAAPDAPIHSVQHGWIHPIADVIGSLLRAGLEIESFAEYPYVAWRMFPWMEQRTDGSWQLPGGAATLPLMFSLCARR
jgi:hypothetical protein